MEAIKLLIILFGLLFIIERKPMNIIFNFIGLIVSVAIVLGQNNTEYLSYLLIIIYCSALTIIFGFVIMLNPNPKGIKTRDKKIYFLIPFILFITFFLFKDNSLNNDSNLSLIFNNDSNLSLIFNNDSNLSLINKIGNLLYTEEINIFKFMIATLILLLALVALFYILMPTTPINPKFKRENNNNV
jgi:NADH:ubiquinone oxidoreductase subunit 6 (subunit J)